FDAGREVVILGPETVDGNGCSRLVDAEREVIGHRPFHRPLVADDAEAVVVLRADRHLGRRDRRQRAVVQPCQNREVVIQPAAGKGGGGGALPPPPPTAPPRSGRTRRRACRCLHRILTRRTCSDRRATAPAARPHPPSGPRATLAGTTPQPCEPRRRRRRGRARAPASPSAARYRSRRR